MNRRTCFLVALMWSTLSSLVLLGQNSGIRFESNVSWKDIVAKAKKENKYVFMDCYATWCGPCKWMVQNIFSNEEVGEYFNTHFINIAVQMDKTSNDSQGIRDWYADVDTIASEYNVRDFPTYLFFAPDGHIIHRVIGAVEDKKEFIARGMEALDGQKQYYSLIRKCEEHKTDSAFLMESIKICRNEDDPDGAAAIGDLYVDCLKDPMAIENIRVIRALIQFCHIKFRKGYNFFLNNSQQIDKSMKDNLYVEASVCGIIYESTIKPVCQDSTGPVLWSRIKGDLIRRYPMLSSGIVNKEEEYFRRNISSELKTYIYRFDTVPINWNRILNHFRKRYPDYKLEDLFMERKTKYFAVKKMWDDCAESAYKWIHRYGSKIGEWSMNNYVWDFIFMHSDNKKILLEAAKWMKPGAEVWLNRTVNVDTYANLLYKLGKADEALMWENRAIELQCKAIERETNLNNRNYLFDQLKEFRINIDKMQKGTPTWDVISGTNLKKPLT